MAFGDYRSGFDQLKAGITSRIGVRGWRSTGYENILAAHTHMLAVANEIEVEDEEHGPPADMPELPGGIADVSLERRLIQAEYLWHKHSRPYYRVFPDYVRMFSNTSLDVPVRYAQMPYPAFVLRFDGGAEFCKVPLDAMLVHIGSEVDVAREMMLDSGVSSQRADEFLGLGGSRTVSSAVQPATHRRHLLVSFQGRGLAPVMGDNRQARIFSMVMPSGEEEDLTLNYWLFQAPDVLHVASAEEESDIRSLLKVAMSVAFLATGLDQIVEPEVLNSDFPAYLEAVNRRDTANVSRMAQRASTANRRSGFVIGRPEDLLGRRETGSRDEGGEGSSLQFQYQRKGHLHRYWTKNDAGERQLTLRFVRQHTVRPDLPVPPVGVDRPGSRTLRTEDEMR